MIECRLVHSYVRAQVLQAVQKEKIHGVRAKNPEHIQKTYKNNREQYVKAATLNRQAQVEGTGLHYVVARLPGPERVMQCVLPEEIPDIPKNAKLIENCKKGIYKEYYLPQEKPKKKMRATSQ